MRSAPAVSYPVGRCRFHLLLVSILALIGVGVYVGWLIHLGPASNPVLILPVGVLLFVLIANALNARRLTPEATVIWSGQRWEYSLSKVGTGNSIETLGGIQVIVDLQSTLLLSTQGAHGSNLWVWAERRKNPGQWLAFRRALVATAKGTVVKLDPGVGVGSNSNPPLTRRGTARPNIAP